jgi:hypothetical protein
MLPRPLLESDAWRSASINARRFIDFLMLEHLAHGGKENGKLKAPYRQLTRAGIGARLIAETIREAEELGLVYVERQGLKVATLYALTWLATADKRAATNAWAAYSNPALPEPKIKKSASPSECRVASP